MSHNKHMKFVVKNEAQSCALQQILGTLGYGWTGGYGLKSFSDKPFIFASEHMTLGYAELKDADYFVNEEGTLMNTEQFIIKYSPDAPQAASPDVDPDAPKVPHIHIDLINEWAKGALVEMFIDGAWRYDAEPFWHTTASYRLKPARVFPETTLDGDAICDFFNDHDDFATPSWVATANMIIRKHILDQEKLNGKS